MPYVSDAQRKFFHTDTARKAGITPADVKHWDDASKGKKLPEHVAKSAAVLDAVKKYTGFKTAIAIDEFVSEKVALIAGSNALQTFTSAMKPVGGGIGASKGLALPMGLGHGLNPTKGMPGTGLGPKANPLAEPSAVRGSMFEGVQQKAFQSADKMKDGATLPARV